MRLCEDCKYVVRPNVLLRLILGHKHDKCKKKVNADGVTMPFCSTERDPYWDSYGMVCGSKGRFFEARDIESYYHTLRQDTP